MIEFLSIKSTYEELKHSLDEAYNRVMNSGWYLLGKEVEKFEEEPELKSSEYTKKTATLPRSEFK